MKGSRSIPERYRAIQFPRGELAPKEGDGITINAPQGSAHLPSFAKRKR